VFFALVNPVAAATNPKDPYERFNRLIFAFNEVVDNGILQPLAKLYNKIIPKPLNKGIGNFYNNIDTIPTVLNDVLQGNIYQATNDAWRLAINSTVGILGFFDVGAEIGLEPNNTQDFGLTMAQWGYKNSNYLVLPFLGPTTIRDGIGFLINYQYLTIYPYIYPVNERYRLYLLGIVERRANLLHFQGVMDEAALDKYVFMRDAFMQRRNYLIERNKELGDPYMNKNQEKTSEMTDDADGST
jgi:phospholipid-binding lipoprotein MlaA